MDGGGSQACLVAFPSVHPSEQCPIGLVLSLLLLSLPFKGQIKAPCLVFSLTGLHSESKESMVLLEIALRTENVICTLSVSVVFSDRMYFGI